ncbi:hypothetical protein [Micromonospora haikouensis]|uniref:hypothetical protein n=1 Tax=Micromonospora haikouensis TaxID=686309 RepID=UPI0037A83CDC
MHVNLAELGITAATTLVAVALGGWLTVRAQDRLWRRDHQRQWRDIRLAAYRDFLTAFREYVAYVLRPDARVVAVPRPRPPHDPMPFFDDEGSAYRERLEATKTAVRLVADGPDTVRAVNAMVRHARLLAADRAAHDVDAVPPERFEGLWVAEREFVLVARRELGMAGDFEIGDRPGGDAARAAASPLAAWTTPGARVTRPEAG